MNWQKVREDFPILKKEINDQPLIYFDHAATSQKPKQVIKAIQDYYEKNNANVYRSVHTLSGEATGEYEEAREKVRNFIGAQSREEIVFTSGTTESINQIAKSLTKKIKAGDEILLTRMEHHSNIIPWQEVAKVTDAKLVYVELTADARIDLEDYKSKLNERTKILAFSHVSNVTGVINPVKEMIEWAKRYSPYILVDGAQAVSHLSIDLVDLNPDFYVFSGHKMLGPTGIGVLYGKKKILEDLQPSKYGGEMIELVEEKSSTWARLPNKFEGGTPNIAGAIALAAAIDYLNTLSFEAIQEKEEDLTAYLLEALVKIDGIKIYGPQSSEDRIGLFSFNLDAIHPHDLATGLDLDGIAIRAGHHCAQLLIREFGVFATSRISINFYNTREEIDQLIQSLMDLKEFFNNEN
ncbi:MAG: SufS family cysteine desulfurase [Atopostipes suicloacalis]|nr:SufS family cysteine desulfurase [Atopostipes suicloacalis]MDN6730648.1 SufS family cysteine desulfurase [Atopostipes suicloacalis]